MSLPLQKMEFCTDEASAIIMGQGTGETIIIVTANAFGNPILQIVADDTVDVSGDFKKGFRLTRKKEDGHISEGGASPSANV